MHFTEVTNDKVKLGQQLGFEDLDSDNVIECIQSCTNELDNETLLNIEEQRAYEDENGNSDHDDCAVPEDNLTAEQLSKIIGMVEKVADYIKEVDPNVERSTTIRRTLNNTFHCYKELRMKRNGNKK